MRYHSGSRAAGAGAGSGSTITGEGAGPGGGSMSSASGPGEKSSSSTTTAHGRVDVPVFDNQIGSYREFKRRVKLYNARMRIEGKQSQVAFGLDNNTFCFLV